MSKLKACSKLLSSYFKLSINVWMVVIYIEDVKHEYHCLKQLPLDLKWGWCMTNNY